MTVDPIRLGYVIAPPPVVQKQPVPGSPLTGDTPRPSFTAELKKACDEVGARVQFSGHACQRVETRNIQLTPAQLKRVDTALDAVAAKGARTALVMLDELAMVVGVDRRTVVTLVDGANLRENVFTAIDAAVIA